MSEHDTTDRSTEAAEPREERTLAQELENFGEHFPKIAALVQQAAKYFRVT